jgi:hypothetical protein
MGHARFFVHVAFGQQPVDVLIGKLHAALVDRVRALAQRHRRHAVVLRHHDVAALARTRRTSRSSTAASAATSW